MIQFKEQEIDRLIWACQYRKEHVDFNKTGAQYWYDTYHKLQHKLETYREELDCADCKYVACDVHA